MRGQNVFKENRVIEREVQLTFVISTSILEEKIWSLFKHRNLTSGNKILWLRKEVAPQEQFLPFPTLFSIHISNKRSLITYSFVKFGCAVCIFLNSENLICRSTDISKCFRGSLQLHDYSSTVSSKPI